MAILRFTILLCVLRWPCLHAYSPTHVGIVNCRIVQKWCTFVYALKLRDLLSHAFRCFVDFSFLSTRIEEGRRRTKKCKERNISKTYQQQKERLRRNDTIENETTCLRCDPRFLHNRCMLASFYLSFIPLFLFFIFSFYFIVLLALSLSPSLCQCMYELWTTYAYKANFDSPNKINRVFAHVGGASCRRSRIRNSVPFYILTQEHRSTFAPVSLVVQCLELQLEFCEHFRFRLNFFFSIFKQRIKLFPVIFQFWNFAIEKKTEIFCLRLVLKSLFWNLSSFGFNF